MQEIKDKLKKGDKVVMHTCMEADNPKYYGKIWTCREDSFLSSSKSEVVFLEGFSGYFLCEYLQIIKQSTDQSQVMVQMVEALDIACEYAKANNDCSDSGCLYCKIGIALQAYKEIKEGK